MAAEPSVTVRTYRRAREIIGQKELHVPLQDGVTVEVLLGELAGAHGFDPDEAIVMVNGRNINHLEGPATRLHANDLVSLTIDRTPD